MICFTCMLQLTNLQDKQQQQKKTYRDEKFKVFYRARN